jgi:hypothetical protein
MKNKILVASLISISAYTLPAIAEWDIRGNVTAQLQEFANSAPQSESHTSNVSLSGEIELYRDLTDDTSVIITPFARIDQRDSERSHFDFRELLVHHITDSFEWKVGLGKVFWGVAESRNPVDVINQSDAVENGDSADKLGQPMINLFAARDWGDIDLYILPGFREQTFPGEDGRPRLPVVIDSDSPRYESNDEEQHIDFALRLFKTVGDWDIGLHAFNGTARDPEFVFNTNTGKLEPFYYQKTQIGIDAQATLESWLLKAELINITADEVEDHIELVTGFEYSFYGIAETDIDLGVVTEWLYDDRDETTNPFQNDLLIGLRLALNDEQSTDALLGVISDLDGDGEILSLEASRRIGSSLKASIDARYWINQPTDSPFDNEDYVQFELGYFF